MALISVIVAVYNGEEYIEECFKSIISQSDQIVDIIVIDGGSTDSTQEIISKYNSHINYWVSEKDNGIYDAWNKALQQVKSNWICFLGSDDMLADYGVISKAVPYLNNADKGNIDLVYGKVEIIDSKTSRSVSFLGESWNNTKRKLRYRMSIPHPGAFHSIRLFKKHGIFRTDLKIGGDYEFLLREYMKEGSIAIFMDGICVTKMRNSGVSSRIGNRLASYKDIQRAKEIHGINRVSIPDLLWRIKYFSAIGFRAITSI